MHDHFMVDELILFGEHHDPVQREKAAKFLALEHIDALKIALLRVELAVKFDGEFNILGMGFCIPKFHCVPP